MTVQTANYYEAIEHLPAGGTLLLTGVPWDEYEELLEAVGEAKGLRISYDSGRLPEIWRFDGQSMTIYNLNRGEYVATDTSPALPILSSRVLTEFLSLSKTKDQYETLLAFEEWLRTQQR